jgi:hypothetical protein
MLKKKILILFIFKKIDTTTQKLKKLDKEVDIASKTVKN